LNISYQGLQEKDEQNNKGQQNAIDRFHRDPDSPNPLVSKTLSSKQTTETKPITPAT
jgi:hypothetical protein